MNKIEISKIKTNKKNPRIIKDDKYKKLIKSIKEFPEMLEIRPIVVDSEMVVLGGNMRLKACKEAGLKEVPVIIADALTEDQKKEFIIKDNVGFGEWDWDVLANEWDSELLDSWGFDLPDCAIDKDDKGFDDFKNKNASMKITFESPEQLQKAENDISEILDRKYPGSSYTINI